MISVVSPWSTTQSEVEGRTYLSTLKLLTQWLLPLGYHKPKRDLDMKTVVMSISMERTRVHRSSRTDWMGSPCQLLDAQKHIYKSMSAYYQHIELFLLSLQNITESAAVLANYPMRHWLQHKVLHSWHHEVCRHFPQLTGRSESTSNIYPHMPNTHQRFFRKGFYFHQWNTNCWLKFS